MTENTGGYKPKSNVIKKYACVAVNKNTNKGETGVVEAYSSKDAKEIFAVMYPDMEVRAAVEIGKVWR